MRDQFRRLMALMEASMIDSMLYKGVSVLSASVRMGVLSGSLSIITIGLAACVVFSAQFVINTLGM